MELPKNTRINEHAIELMDKKQPPYELINALCLVKLETLKIYIETHLKTGFIRLSKFPVDVSELFDKKLDGCLRMCVNYWGLYNFMIKNQYPLLLTGEFLDWLGRVKQFT